jgi:hypothetical protein
MRTFTYKKQGDGHDSWICDDNGSKSIIYVTPLQYVTKLLSDAFDAKFEAYWKAKGYSDLHDLNSHVANPNSPHHTEALALIQWSHTAWEIAVADVNENSNVQAIIQSLPKFEPAP